jgi:hypothetical protein
MGVYLIGLRLIGMYLMGVHLVGMVCLEAFGYSIWGFWEKALAPNRGMYKSRIFFKAKEREEMIHEWNRRRMQEEHCSVIFVHGRQTASLRAADWYAYGCCARIALLLSA